MFFQPYSDNSQAVKVHASVEWCACQLSTARRAGVYITALCMAADTATPERLLALYKGLVEVSALINGITDSDELLPAILDVSRRVLGVEAASLFLVRPDGDLELTAARGTHSSDVAPTEIKVPRGRGIAGWVLEHGEPLLIADAYADPRFYREVDRQTGFHTRSILCVPMRRGDQDIGVLQVLNPLGRHSFDEADLEAFTAYGTLAATAIDKLRTIERQRQQQRVEQEFAFAREIQASFLPQALPQLPNVSFAATYRPALNVGGDFYDVMAVGPDEIYFVIADVSGKGMPAALLMAQALSVLRMILKPGLAPAAALARWNQMLTGHTVRGMFITAILGRILCSERRIEMSSAGHCHPFRVGPTGSPSEIRVSGTPPLGLLPELPARSHTLEMNSGEWLVLYTDGLVESFNTADVPLDKEGVARLLDAPFRAPSDVVDALNVGELNHRQQAPPHDDLTILVLGFK